MKNKKIVCIFNIIWAWLCCLKLPYFFSIKFDSLEITNSVFSLVFVVAVAWFMSKVHFESTRQMVLTHILGFIYAMMTGLGHQLDTYSMSNIKGLLFPVILYGHLFAVMIALLWQCLGKAAVWLSDNSFSVLDNVFDWLNKHPYVITLILFVCWLPCFLSDFPGGFRHDAAAELNQANIPQYNPAFPFLHSAIITHFIPFLYRITGSYNVGIAIYVLAQMVLIAVLYTHIVRIFYEKQINSLILLFIVLYMGLFPTIQMLVEFSGRDMLFTGLLIYTIFLIYEMMTENRLMLRLAFILPLTVYSRNNSSSVAFLAIMIVLVGIITISHFKDNPKKAIVFSLSSIGFYIVLGMVLTAMCQPMVSTNTKKTVREKMGLYAQTLSRAYVLENDTWTAEELDELCRYVDPEILAKYSPTLSDTVRESIFVLEDNKSEFVDFWWKIGKKHPGAYLDAILLCSQPAWDPSAVLYSYVTARPEGYYGREKMYFSISPETEEPPAEHVNLLPAVNKFYQWIGLDISFEKIPVVSLLFSIGFHFWFVMNAFFYLIYHRMHKLAIPVAIVFVYAVICLFVPIVLVRYFALLFFAMPIIVGFILEPKKASQVTQ